MCYRLGGRETRAGAPSLGGVGAPTARKAARNMVAKGPHRTVGGRP